MTKHNKVFKEIMKEDEINKKEPEVVHKSITKEMTKIKYQCFSKVKFRHKSTTDKHLDKLHRDKLNCTSINKQISIDSAISTELEKKRKENLEKQIESIKNVKLKKGTTAAIFNLKESVVGSKTIKQETTIIKDPVTKSEVNTIEEIKRVSLNYCKDLLTNRDPKPGFEDILLWKYNVHEERMIEYLPNEEPELSLSMFNAALRRLNTKHADKYAFILKGGQSLLDAVFHLFKLVWSTEKIPSGWRKTSIVQLYKGKGDHTELSNYRNIHTKDEIRKVFGDIVTHELKLKVQEGLSKFQIGAVANHRPQEHLYTIKSVISYYNMKGKGLILSLYDISKYFDRENLRDCMSELYNCGVKGKIYRLTYELNKNTEISVKTAVGSTEFCEVGELVGQGTNEGAVISSVNLDGGIREYFEDSNKEVVYSGLTLGPCLFQDDISRLAEDLAAVREGNDRVEKMAESKLLDFNLDKSCIVIIGKRKFRQKIERELEASPIIFCNQPMQTSESEKYLGDYVGSSLSESVFVTVLKRKGLSLKLISEIKLTIEDCRSKVLGGILTGLEIWKMAVVPFLFGNCETWMEIPKKATNLLNSIQNTFFRSLFGICNGCPIPAFYWDTGTLLATNYIMLKKLLFLHHLSTLPENSLAKEIFDLQKENALPGLVSECDSFMTDLGIDNDPTVYTKNQWKKLVKGKVNLKNKNDLLNMIKSYKKLDYDKIVNEDYGEKSYLKTMNIFQARTCFAARAQTLRTVQMNFMHKPEYIHNNWKCKCGEDDHQSHLPFCQSYAHLRDGLDLQRSDLDLVVYYQRVIREREQEEERGSGVERGRGGRGSLVTGQSQS